MKIRQWLGLTLILCFCCLVACKRQQLEQTVSVLHSLKSFQELVDSTYQINTDTIYRMVRVLADEQKQYAPWDSAVISHYTEKGTFLWLNDSLIADPTSIQTADSLIFWLEQIARHGISPNLYSTADIRQDLRQVRTIRPAEGKTLNRLLADIEYRLTAAYLSYVCRLNFGFLPLQERWSDSINRIPLKDYDKAFALAALDSLQLHGTTAFRRMEPSSPLYRRMQEELERVNAGEENDSTTYYRTRLLANLERERWQYKLDKGKKYVLANVAACMLQAVDEETDSILEMRVCVGSMKHKTPLLSSRIHYMELNPYWNIPQSIIRKEMIPAYLRDTTYFTHHRMKVYDMKTGLRVDPRRVQWAKYRNRGVPYTVKQDNKEGNSLGRIIFRFPNAHAVYLHDTPSRTAFLRKNRAVSHGCIRLQKPLDFSFFLLKEHDELLEDRIRIAMDIKPITEAGKKLSVSSAYRELKHYSLKEYIPLFIDYRTVYLSADGELSYCEDVYRYDPSLLKAMEILNLKP